MSLFEASLIPALDPDGDPISGATWSFFASGTNTPLAVYANAELTVSLGDTVTANAAGRFQPIYVDDTRSVRAVLKYASGEIVPRGDVDPINLGPFNQTSKGGFWTDWDVEASGLPLPPGTQATDGIILELKDRVFLGWAVGSSGNFPASTKDRYDAFEAARTDYRGFRTSFSQMAIGAKNGGIGVLGYAFSSDSNLDGLQLGMGVMGASVNDNTVNQQHTCGGYFVGWRMPGAGQGVPGTGTIGGEVDICNFGNSVQVTPGNIYPSTGFTTAWQVNSGASSRYSAQFPSSSVPNSASAGITFGNNRGDFLSGMVFAANSIAGVVLDGNGQPYDGAGSAIRMAAFQQLEWWTYPWSQPSFVVSSKQLSAANFQSIEAKDTGIFMGGPAGAGLAFQTIYPGGNTGSWFYAAPATGAAPATLGITGGAANGNLRLRAKGAGVVSFGIYTAEAITATGYITIADDSGTLRRILVG